MRASTAALLGVGLAAAVGAIAVARRGRPVESRVVETTRAIRVVRRDGLGLPEKKGQLRDRARVRAMTEALGIDAHPGGACPADYAEADIGIILSGDDVYARRNVYVFGLVGSRKGDAGGAGDAGDAGDASDAGDAGDASTPRSPPQGGAASVVSVTSAGCRVGPPADRAALERELRAAGVLE
jgi:hypothetical protein